MHRINLPLKTEESLRSSYLASSRSDIQRHKQLCELIRVFNDNGIEHIPLKGSHLAEKVYSNSVLRTMCDIDILVRKEDIERAFNLLVAQGYSDGSRHGSSKIVKDVFVHHYPILTKKNSLPVELHRYLFENNDLKNIDLIWYRAQKSSIGSVTSKLMTSEDMLIYIALHGLKYHTQKLGIKFLYDMHTIICSGYINWKSIAELIKHNDWGNSKTLYSVLVIVKKYFHTDIPEGFMDTIRPIDFNQNIQTSIEELIWERRAHNQLEAYTFSYYLFHALKNMSLKNIVRQSLFSPEQISSENKMNHRGWRIYELYFRSFLAILAAFIRTIYQVFCTNNDEVKKAFQLGRKAGILTHWLES